MSGGSQGQPGLSGRPPPSLPRPTRGSAVPQVASPPGGLRQDGSRSLHADPKPHSLLDRSPLQAPKLQLGPGIGKSSPPPGLPPLRSISDSPPPLLRRQDKGVLSSDNKPLFRFVAEPNSNPLTSNPLSEDILGPKHHSQISEKAKRGSSNLSAARREERSIPTTPLPSGTAINATSHPPRSTPTKPGQPALPQRSTTLTTLASSAASGPARQSSEFFFGLRVADQTRGEGQVTDVTGAKVRVRFADGGAADYSSTDLADGILQPAGVHFTNISLGTRYNSEGLTPQSDDPITPIKRPAENGDTRTPLLAPRNPVQPPVAKSFQPGQRVSVQEKRQGSRLEGPDAPAAARVATTLLRISPGRAECGESSSASERSAGSPKGKGSFQLQDIPQVPLVRGRRGREKTFIEKTTGVAKGSALRVAKLNVMKLQEVFQEASGGDGHQSGTEDVLYIDGFRRLWQTVFPWRHVDNATYAIIQGLFNGIDKQGKGWVTWDELVGYLEHHCEQELKRTQRPNTFQMWCWQLTSPEVSQDWADLSNSTDRYITRFVSGWKITSQVLVIISIGLILVETTTSMQDDGAENVGLGNDITSTTELACVIFFTIELLCFLIGYPRRPVDRSDDAERDDDSSLEENVKTEKCIPLCTDLNTWIDLFSVLPFYISRVVEATAEEGDNATKHATPLAVVRVARLFRLL
eukprot:Hpha_TRINITY_DN10769_c0_g2::TRINITY_DN10769_c0_g2_i1::g.43550::m.43550